MNKTLFMTATTALIFFVGAASDRVNAQSATTTGNSSVTAAFDVAKDGVDSSMRSKLVSIYGTGTPTTIQKWYVIFFDPSVPSHGRSVLVENSQVTRVYEAKGGVVYDDTLTFAPSSVASESAALGVAQDYASQHAIAYDQVRVLFRQRPGESAPRWRVELRDAGLSKGFVFMKPSDNSFAMYLPANSVPVSNSDPDSVADNAKKAGNYIKNTFLGIGGDLQEFFTGDRTVDQ